jgi:hypothetical protein
VAINVKHLKSFALSVCRKKVLISKLVIRMFYHNEFVRLNIGHFGDIFEFFMENLDHFFEAKNDLQENTNEAIFCSTSVEGIMYHKTAGQIQILFSTWHLLG